MAARSSSSPRAFRLIGGGVRMPSLYCLARLRIRLFHPHAAGAKGGNQDMRRTKEDSTPNTSGRGYLLQLWLFYRRPISHRISGL